MASNPEQSIHRLWQDQPRDEQTMSLDYIRAKAQHFDAKTRRWLNVGRTAFILIVIGNITEFGWPGQHLLERVGNLLSIAAVFYVSSEYRRMRGRLVAMPEGLGLTSCVEFHRSQLAQERDLAQQSRRYLLPFVPGVGLSLFGGVAAQGLSTPRAIGVAAFGVALFVGAAALNAYTARKLQRAIDAL